MIQVVVEEIIRSFLKSVSQKTGVTIRWIWFGRKYTFEEILKSQWNVRIGLIVIVLIFVTIVAIVA